MRSITIIPALIATGFLSLLGGCGGSPGGSIGIDGSGERPKSAVSGPINGFGSIIVNGVRYNTDNAQIYIGETLANEQLLDVGDYVTVIGSKDPDGLNGVAQSVHYQPNVKGPISSISLANNSITVLGQTLVLTSDTTFGSAISPRDISGLNTGDIIEVSGPRDSSNRIVVTRADYAEADALELTGTVYGLEHEIQSFFVNGVQVNFAQSGLNGEITDGVSVLVTGANYTNNILYAESVDSLKDYRNLTSVPDIEHTGYVTEFNNEHLFRVGDITVKTNTETIIVNSAGSALGLDSKVRVLGFFEADDSLHANQIEILSSSQLKLLGPITVITTDDENTNILGLIMVQDILATVTTATRMYDANGQPTNRLYYNDLRVGDSVIVTGYTENNIFIATAIEYESSDLSNSAQILIGYPYNIDYDNQRFGMYDIAIEWNDDTRFGLNNDLSPNDVIQYGVNIEILGTYHGSTFVAHKISLK